MQISPEWLQRRRNIITQLKTVANNLSKLHDTTTIIDKIGTSVAVAGNGLKIGALFTGLINGQDPSQEALNAGNWLRLFGIGTSATAQLYEKTESYERIRQLRTDLQRDQRDFEALQNLLDTIDDVVRRLNLAAPLLAKLRHLSPTDWLMLYNNVSTIYLRSGGDASDCKEEWNALGKLLRDDTLTVFLRENVESLGRIKLSSLNSEPLRITWNMIDQSASAIRELVDNNRRDTAAALVNYGMAFVLNINHLRNLLTANETEPQHILSLRNYARQMQNELDRAS